MKEISLTMLTISKVLLLISSSLTLHMERKRAEWDRIPKSYSRLVLLIHQQMFLRSLAFYLRRRIEYLEMIDLELSSSGSPSTRRWYTKLDSRVSRWMLLLSFGSKTPSLTRCHTLVLDGLMNRFLYSEKGVRSYSDLLKE